MNNDSLQGLNRQQLETSVIECHAAWERERDLRRKYEQELACERCLRLYYKSDDDVLHKIRNACVRS